MKIKAITWRHGHDFRAIYQCDAGHEHEAPGYGDAYFHNVVVPGMTCPECSEDAADHVTVLPEWPKAPSSAEEMIRYCLGVGLWASARAIDLVGVARRQGRLGGLRRHINSLSVIESFNCVYLLKRLIEIDPALADEAAAEMWRAADAGDSYGEALWEWATEAGLDADAICEASRSALANETTDG